MDSDLSSVKQNARPNWTFLRRNGGGGRSAGGMNWQRSVPERRNPDDGRRGDSDAGPVDYGDYDNDSVSV